MRMIVRCLVFFWLITIASGVVFHAQEPGAPPARARPEQPLLLTLDTMVELGLADSYRVRQLQLEVDRTRTLLRAERAGLKSRVQLVVNAPQIEAITENQWNSTLQRDELIAQDTQRLQLDFSVRQPVVLFGYPTNGVFSFNNRVYRYDQDEGDTSDTRYYNRFFFAYDQPLFQPNRMKNDLERAELDLEDAELEYLGDVVSMVDDLAEDYFELVESAYRQEIASQQVREFEAAMESARLLSANDSTRVMEADQLQVALANARQDFSQLASNQRLQQDDVKQRLRLAASNQLMVPPTLDFRPVHVDEAEAIRLAKTVAPRMRQLSIDLKENEIRMDETKGDDAFRMNLGMTYGREMQDPLFQRLWEKPRNSYTVNISATVPIFDWGERRLRIQAQQSSIDRAHLAIEEADAQIETNVRSQLRSLQEYQQRLVSMQQNLDLARSLTAAAQERYRAGDVTLADLLQTVDREARTSGNFLEAFLGCQEALQSLQQLTYFDFERGTPLVERFTIQPGGSADPLPLTDRPR